MLLKFVDVEYQVCPVVHGGIIAQMMMYLFQVCLDLIQALPHAINAQILIHIL